MYNCKVQFELVKSIKETVGKLYLKNKEGFELNTEPGGLFLNFDIYKYYIFINTNSLFHGIIAHEIFHLSEALSRDRDIIDEEAKAYLISSITQNIYNFLKSKDIQVA
jgi:hypothetical protein